MKVEKTSTVKTRRKVTFTREEIEALILKASKLTDGEVDFNISCNCVIGATVKYTEEKEQEEV